MTILDLLVIGGLSYFIVTRFTSNNNIKKNITKTDTKSKRKSPVEVKVIKSNSVQSKQQVDEIIKKFREEDKKLQAELEKREQLEGLEKVKAYDKSFTEKSFLKGAEVAYKWYYDALNKDDESVLQDLVAPRIYSEIVEHLDSLDERNEKEEIEIVKLEQPILLDCKTIAKSAFIDVKYKAELLVKTINTQTKEETTETQNVEVVWTWARNIISTDPNWQLDGIQTIS